MCVCVIIYSVVFSVCCLLSCPPFACVGGPSTRTPRFWVGWGGASTNQSCRVCGGMAPVSPASLGGVRVERCSFAGFLVWSLVSCFSCLALSLLSCLSCLVSCVWPALASSFLFCLIPSDALSALRSCLLLCLLSYCVFSPLVSSLRWYFFSSCFLSPLVSSLVVYLLSFVSRLLLRVIVCVLSRAVRVSCPLLSLVCSLLFLCLYVLNMSLCP